MRDVPRAGEIRAAAWKRMKEGGLLPLVAGFALVMLLAYLADNVVNWLCLSRGWITKISVLDFLEESEFLTRYATELTPEQEKMLGSTMIPLMSPTCRVFVFIINAIWENGILAFGCAVLAVSAMRGGAKAFLVLSGFRLPMLLRTASLGILRIAVVALGFLLFILPGVLAAYSYRMAFMLLADNPDWSPVRALRESRQLMHGHRWRLFCLDISFFGWFLLVGVTFGLGGIFVMPYFATANAAFYEDLLDRAGR